MVIVTIPENHDLLLTCSEKGDGLEKGEFFGVEVELGQVPDVLLDLADGGGDLAHPGGRELLLGHGGLQVADDRGQHGRQVHGLGALGHAQHEDVRPAVPDQRLLCVVPGNKPENIIK